MPEFIVIKRGSWWFMLKIPYKDEYYSGINKKTIRADALVPLSDHSQNLNAKIPIAILAKPG
ncbi:hypothetical protein [Enterobacter cloacae complex sp. 2024EL-00597]|uniref:hypothetical protein n=1 Tax=Enterobacter cloacae complex sp. 2024EL-00597 TaxID=3350186 RepID=UPI00361C155A